MNKILARKSGWLIAVKVLRETPKAYIVEAYDENKEIRVSKNSTSEGLFNDTLEAIDWIRY